MKKILALLYIMCMIAGAAQGCGDSTPIENNFQKNPNINDLKNHNYIIECKIIQVMRSYENDIEPINVELLNKNNFTNTEESFFEDTIKTTSRPGFFTIEYKIYCKVSYFYPGFPIGVSLCIPNLQPVWYIDETLPNNLNEFELNFSLNSLNENSKYIVQQSILDLSH